MTDRIGQAISHYRILSRIGEGGMGVIYRAEDTQLGRTVALKALPDSLLGSEARRTRFLQEARTASALNHPNIVTVHDLIHESDSDFLVMEYVEGRTLEQVLHGKGLPLGEALRLAVPIADALAVAHRAGVVHRDLKPGNVMVSHSGVVKVLDFGLAKMLEPGTDEGPAEGLTAASTEVGTILGTVAFMSPEQAQGRKVDARSDIFSFGAMLYEMITGHRAFRADSQAGTLAAVIGQEPKPAGELAHNLPPEVDRLLQRCLRKDPDKRWQTMADLKVALEELKEDSDSGRLRVSPPAARRPGRFEPRLAVVGGVLLLAALLGFWIFYRASPNPSRTIRKVPLTSYRGSELEPAISPDGKQVAFIWDGKDGDNFDLYLRLVDAGEPLRLTSHPARESSPRWSPDGLQLAFCRQGSVYVVPSLGGPERKLVDAAPHPGNLPLEELPQTPALLPEEWLISGRLLTQFDWHPNGKELVLAEAEGLFLYDLESGRRSRLTASATSGGRDASPAFSPDGRHIAFVRPRSDQGQMNIMIAPLDGGEPRPIVADQGFNHSPCWTASGEELVFNRQWESLFRVSVRGGTPQRILEADDNAAATSIARSANRLIYSRLSLDMNIWMADLSSGAQPRQLVASTFRDFSAQVSPDGRRLAFTSDRSGGWEIWTSDLSGDNQKQLTSFGNAVADGAQWSPDGREIVFALLLSGNRDIQLIDAEGGPVRALTSDPSDEGRPFYSRDGRTLYFRSNRSGDDQLWRMTRDSGAPEQVTRGGGFDGQEALDGSKLYFTLGRRKAGLWSIAPTGGDASPVPGTEAVLPGMWAVTEAGIYSLERAASSLYLVLHDPVGGAAQRILEAAAPVWSTAPALSATRDGQRVFWHQDDQSGADLVLLENFR